MIYGRHYINTPLDEWFINGLVKEGYEACYRNVPVIDSPYEMMGNWNNLDTQGGRWYKGWLLACGEIGYKLFTGEIREIPQVLLDIKESIDAKNGVSEAIESLLSGWIVGADEQVLKIKSQGNTARINNVDISEAPFKEETIYNPLDEKYFYARYSPLNAWVDGWLEAEEKIIIEFRKQFHSEIEAALKQLYIVKDDYAEHYKNQFKSPITSPLKWFKGTKYVMDFKAEYKRELYILDKAHIQPDFDSGVGSYHCLLEHYLNQKRKLIC